MTKFRKGDEVTITGIVRHDFDSAEDNYIHVDLNGTLGPSTHIFYPTLLTMKRAHFEPGDMVCWSMEGDDNMFTAEVLAISGDHLWLDVGSGVFATRHIDTVARVEPESAPSFETDAPLGVTEIVELDQ